MGEVDSDTTNAHVQAGHTVLSKKPNVKFDVAHTVNHFLIEPVIWAISGYGIILGIIASYTWGFFTLHEYTIAGVGLILNPSQIQQYYFWYDAYPYSLLIFGTYLLALYIKFNWIYKDFFKPITQFVTTPYPSRGYLALPVFIITYATWDFLGIGANIVKGYSIIWLAISVIGLIYYFPIRKEIQINVSLFGLIIFYGVGILYLPGIFLTKFPFTHIIIANNTINQYFEGLANEATFCLLCLLSISPKQKDSHGNIK